MRKVLLILSIFILLCAQNSAAGSIKVSFEGVVGNVESEEIAEQISEALNSQNFDQFNNIEEKAVKFGSILTNICNRIDTLRIVHITYSQMYKRVQTDMSYFDKNNQKVYFKVILHV